MRRGTKNVLFELLSFHSVFQCTHSELARALLFEAGSDTLFGVPDAFKTDIPLYSHNHLSAKMITGILHIYRVDVLKHNVDPIVWKRTWASGKGGVNERFGVPQEWVSMFDNESKEGF